MPLRYNGKTAVLYAASLLALGSSALAGDKQATDKIPITTASEEARQLYIKGRDLNERLRATDARKLFVEAVAKDKSFALGYVGLANTSGTAKEFFDAVKQAVALAGKASEGERLWIQGIDAGARGEPAKQREAWTKLVAAFPKDERAHNLLGIYYFGQQEYAAAIEEYKKAVEINPSFSAPLNQLGYAYRFIEKYADAEQAFKKYIELIPDDPNPYDSYAELLMKMGRFDESIKNYEKALAVDKNFVASYIGIGNNQMFMGKGEEARKTFGKLASVARNNGEKRQALFWMAVSYIHEGAADKAVAEVEKERAIADAEKDMANAAADLNLIGNILLEAGQPDQAAAKFKEQLDTMSKANVPAEVKQATKRNSLFDEARVAIAKKDLAGAKAKAKEYAKQVAVKKVSFEVRQSHELNGIIAVEEKDYAAAVTELEQANQQDPRVHYFMALALRGKGDAAKARTAATKAAEFNALGVNYAYVRRKAKDLLAKS